MERGRRLTAEEKGKGVMPEKKKTTQEEKEAEAALRASHAADLQERGFIPPLQIRDNTAPSTRTSPPAAPATQTQAGQNEKCTESSMKLSEKETEDGFNLHVLASQMQGSVVTIAAVSYLGSTVYTHYHTGFILISQKNYTLVFTRFPPENDEVDEYNVYFEGSNVKNEAEELLSDQDHFLILIIRTEREYAPVIFSDDPLARELVFTIGSTGGAKYNANGTLIDELVGSVVTYRGKVAVSAYTASDLDFHPIHEAERFFEVTCSVHDDIINLKNIDKKTGRTTNAVLCAPVFRFDGTVGGIIFSPGNWGDVKCGLHAKDVISLLQSMCGTDKWQEHLRKTANEWMFKNTNHHP